jgi:hypothetical protein
MLSYGANHAIMKRINRINGSDLDDQVAPF